MIKLNEYGRSMIEMLGVLAIVGVLSVGGIAGYSKAMTNYKMNKLLSEYVEFFTDVIRHKEDWFYEHKKRNPESYANNSLFRISNFLDDVIDLPNGWSGDGEENMGVYDSLGGIVYAYVRKPYVQFDIFLSVSGASKMDLGNKIKCRMILSRLMNEFVDDLYWVAMYQNAQRKTDYLYGNKYCGVDGKKCYSSITLADINSMCEIPIDDVGGLAITIKMN